MVLIFYDTICPRSSEPFYTVTYCIKGVPTSWTHSISNYVADVLSEIRKLIPLNQCSFYYIERTV